MKIDEPLTVKVKTDEPHAVKIDERSDDELHDQRPRSASAEVGQRARTATAPIWHETFKVAARNYEAIYQNMPPHRTRYRQAHVPVSQNYESEQQWDCGLAEIIAATG